MVDNKITIGVLTLLLLSGIVIITFQNDLRIRVDNDKSTFYTKNDNNRWVVAGREYNSLFDGSSKMNRVSKSIVVDTQINEETNEVVVTRHTEYIRGPTVIDTYLFNSEITSIEMFPISHTVEVIGGKDFFYRYEVRDLVYDGPTNYKATSPASFGRNMKVTWQDGYNWAHIYKAGILKAQYKIESDYEVFEVRLFDPAGECDVDFSDGCTVSTSMTLNGSDFPCIDAASNGCIVINANDVTLDCAGTKIHGNGTGRGIQGLAKNNTKIINCEITNYDIGIRYNKGTYSNISQNHIYNVTSTGIELTNSNHSTIDSNILDNATTSGSGKRGIVIQQTGIDITISNNIIRRFYDLIFYNTASAANMSENIIDSNNFTESYNMGLWITPTSDANTISNNRFERCGFPVGANAIDINSDRNKIYNNYFYNWSDKAVDFFDNSDDYSITTGSFNEIYDNEFIGASGKESIYLATSDNTAIYDNDFTCYPVSQACITIEGNQTVNYDNRVYGNSFTFGNYSIKLGSVNNNIYDNTFNSPTKKEIFISSFFKGHDQTENSTINSTSLLRFDTASWGGAEPTIVCPADSATYVIQPAEEWEVDCGSDGNWTPENGETATEDKRVYTSTLYLSKGIIGNSDDITITGNDATLIGNGTNGFNGIYVSSDDRVTIQDLNFVGYDRCMFITNSINITLDDITLTDCTEAGIRIAGSDFINITNSEINNNSRGINIVVSEDISIYDNTFFDNTIATIIESNSNRTDIHQNTFINDSASSIYSDDSFRSNFYSNVITAPAASGTSSGIRFVGEGGSHSVRNNDVSGHTYGIRIGTLNPDSNITDNNVSTTGHWTVATESNNTIISRNNITYSGWNLIYIGSYYNTITHNTLDSFVHHGIDMHNDARYLLSGFNYIAHNTIQRNHPLYGGDNAIYVTATASNIVYNNTMKNIINASLTGDSGNGISVEGNVTRDNQIISNTFDGISGFCVRDGGINNTYTNNYFKNCERDIVYRTLSIHPAMGQHAVFIDNIFGDGVADYRATSEDTNITVNETSSQYHSFTFNDDNSFNMFGNNRKTVHVIGVNVNATDIGIPNIVMNGTSKFGQSLTAVNENVNDDEAWSIFEGTNVFQVNANVTANNTVWAIDFAMNGNNSYGEYDSGTCTAIADKTTVAYYGKSTRVMSSNVERTASGLNELKRVGISSAPKRFYANGLRIYFSLDGAMAPATSALFGINLNRTMNISGLHVDNINISTARAYRLARYGGTNNDTDICYEQPISVI